MRLSFVQLFLSFLTTTQAFGFGKDPTKGLSSWLEKQTNSNDLLENIAATELGKRTGDAPVEADVLINLKTLAVNLRDNKLSCSSDEIKSLRDASALLNKSKKDPYTTSKPRRFNRLVIGLQRRVVSECLSRFNSEINETRRLFESSLKVDIIYISRLLSLKQGNKKSHQYLNVEETPKTNFLNRLRAIIQLNRDDLIERKRLKSWTEWFKEFVGAEQFCGSSDYTDLVYVGSGCQVGRSRIEKVLEEKFINPCRGIIEADHKTGDVVLRSNILVEQTRIEPADLLNSNDDYSGLFLLGSGLHMCKLIVDLNWTPVVDNIVQYVNHR